jgi:hypothetical protein
LGIVDLSGAVPNETNYPLPSPINPIPQGGLYAAVSASQWVVANGGNGVVLDGASLATTPRYFGYGKMRSVVGSQSRFAVATALGNVLVYNASDLSLETTLNISAQQLSISGDGSILAVLHSDGSVETVSLPSGAIINTWPAGSAGKPTLSVSGALLALVVSNGTSEVTSSSGGPVLWSGAGSPVLLSLDDTLIAATGNTDTIIYKNYVESAAVSGTGVGWLQNDELLVNASNAGAIFNSSGIKLSGPALPALNGPIQVLSATSIYDTVSNSIYSLSTGAKTWSPPANPSAPGAVAGTVVVFTNDLNQLVTEPY